MENERLKLGNERALGGKCCWRWVLMLFYLLGLVKRYESPFLADSYNYHRNGEYWLSHNYHQECHFSRSSWIGRQSMIVTYQQYNRLFLPLTLICHRDDCCGKKDTSNWLQMRQCIEDEDEQFSFPPWATPSRRRRTRSCQVFYTTQLSIWICRVTKWVHR